MTQAAAEMGVCISCLSRWENGQNLMRADTALLVATYYSITCEYLLQGKEESQ